MSKPIDYATVVSDLRLAYDRGASDRDQMGKAEWKLVERARFSERLRDERKEELIELGAGTGQDSLCFSNQGLKVVATDLSPNMVSHCREKGLDARIMDCTGLAFEAEAFDAAYAINCLLHLPNAEFDIALSEVHRVLRPGALFFIGLYGGNDSEESLSNDRHVPPRYFCFRSDAVLLELVARRFELVDFHTVEREDLHFQSLTVRRT